MNELRFGRKKSRTRKILSFFLFGARKVWIWLLLVGTGVLAAGDQMFPWPQGGRCVADCTVNGAWREGIKTQTSLVVFLVGGLHVTGGMERA